MAALFEWKLTKQSRTQILVMTHSYDTPYHVRHIFSMVQHVRQRKNSPVRLKIPEATNLKWESYSMTCFNARFGTDTGVVTNSTNYGSI